MPIWGGLGGGSFGHASIHASIHSCIHASLSSPSAQLSHATHCPSCGKWTHEQHSRVGADGGDRVSKEGIPRDLTVNRSHENSRGHLPARGGQAVCVSAEVSGTISGSPGPFTNDRRRVRSPRVVGGGRSLGLKMPCEVQGIRLSRPQRCDPVYLGHQQCGGFGVSPGAMAQILWL